MRVKGRKRWVYIKRKRWVHIKDGYYAITKILERKRKRDGSIICKVEWVGSLTIDWVSEDALCGKSCKRFSVSDLPENRMVQQKRSRTAFGFVLGVPTWFTKKKSGAKRFVPHCFS